MSADTLLILQDSPAYGGHEAMFLALLPGVLESGRYRRIVIRYPEANAGFAAQLAPLASATFEARGWRYAKRRAEPYLGPLRRRYIGAVRSLIAAERPRALLLLQGRIENCVVPLLTAPRDMFVASYIPMAHGMAEIGRRPFPGDMMRRRLYRRPDRFIVPGRAIGAQLRAAGARAPVVVVDNLVMPPPRPDRRAARAAIGVDIGARVALLLGRLDIRQKGIDVLVATLRAQADALAGWTLLVAGEGEGRPLIEEAARDLAGRVDVRLVGWTDTPHLYLAASDLLLMPSRWEGVPLTMLEAAAYGVPVLASDIDIFRDRLPASQRIDFAHADLAASMAAAVAAAVPGRTARSEDIERARTRFAQALIPEGAVDGPA